MFALFMFLVRVQGPVTDIVHSLFSITFIPHCQYCRWFCRGSSQGREVCVMQQEPPPCVTHMAEQGPQGAAPRPCTGDVIEGSGER